jgi:hypothetical protein
MNKLLGLLMLIGVSLGAYAQHDHASHSQEKGKPEFKDQKAETAYSHYTHLKDVLVASNTNEAKKAAAELQKSLASVENGKKAAEIAGKIVSSTDLKDQRRTFSALSNEMTTIVKASKLASGSLYLVYCPMANGNEGAFWLSNEKEIKNPYFGDMMLKCGSIKETLQ